MVGEKLDFDLIDSEDGHYKSNFARSVAVNLSHQNKVVEQLQRPQSAIDFSKGASPNQKSPAAKPMALELPEVVRLRKDSRNNNNDELLKRISWGSTSSSRRASFCSSSNKIPETSIENYFLQSQVETLQWQLKETESSREMYRAVMKQVVIFLERAHRSLELLGTRINSRSSSRPRSEVVSSTINETFSNLSSATTSVDNASLNSSDSHLYKEISWRRSKKPEASPEEVPPEKLSQEAFRLLRTAQSLLSTHEPDLARVASNSEEDINFLAQLAREFPTAEPKPQRAPSFSLCPKLLTPEKDAKTLNRKYSLQLNDTLRRNSFLKDVSSKLNRSSGSSRSSVAESDCILTSTLLEDNRTVKACKFKYEKSSSPPVSNAGSAEDESGFSSMNSFQEVGLPNVNIEDIKSDYFVSPDEIKLWHTPDTTIHKRWSSTPVENLPADNPPLKVLWV